MRDNKFTKRSMGGFSFNILDTATERYGDWVDPKISMVRIIQKSGSTFLEFFLSNAGVERFNLDFIIGDEDTLEPLFSPNFSAQSNAERFFNELDLFSIVMTGVGDLLFTKEGLDAAAELCEADKGEPLGIFTRR